MSNNKHPQIDPFMRGRKTILNIIHNHLGLIILHLLIGMVIGIIFFFLFSMLVTSPKEKRLMEENETLKTNYELLNKRIKQLEGVMSDLQMRDDNLYRVIFRAAPVSDKKRNGGSVINNRYLELSDMSMNKLAIEAETNLNRLEQHIYAQSQSFDQLATLAYQRREILANIPAIQPLRHREMKKITSGFGTRIDPISGEPKTHSGIDITANQGTPVFATGNGEVIFADWHFGYGYLVIIDHGFDTFTYYAHLHKMKTKVGRQVKRGDQIGEVGSTGKSTGTHLHYEVRIKNIPQNPVNYFFLDLTPQEYDKMIRLSQDAGDTLD